MLLAALLGPCVLATLIGVLLLHPFGYEQPTGEQLGLHLQPVHGTVTAVEQTSCDPQGVPPITDDGSAPSTEDAEGAPDEVTDGGTHSCVAVTVHLTDGPAPGTSLRMLMPLEPSAPRFAVDDQVVLAYSGTDPHHAGSYQLVDFQRGTPMLLLAVLFAAAVLLLGRLRGLASLGGLLISFAVLAWFVFPAILAGRNPLAVAVVGGCLIMFVTTYLAHGLSARTSTAVLGVLASLALTGLLALVFTSAAQLTGLDDDTTNLIGLLGHAVDARGLLLAGMVIGALGVLDDITVTQASAVWELRRANPTLGWLQLYRAALRIGRDHVVSAVNTLFMAYAGAALPMLLAYSVSGQNFVRLVTAQDVAQEVVRTLVGSIGLVAAIPVTTALAAVVARQEPVTPVESAEPAEHAEAANPPAPVEESSSASTPRRVEPPSGEPEVPAGARPTRRSRASTAPYPTPGPERSSPSEGGANPATARRLAPPRHPLPPRGRPVDRPWQGGGTTPENW